DIIPDSSVQSTEAGKGPFGSRKKVFRTHMYPECLPCAVKEKQTKVVYVARNPKDVAVSYFFFHQLTAHLGQQSDLTFDEFFPIFFSGKTWVGSWFKHVRTLWKFTQNNPNATFVFYEDMQRDLAGVVQSMEQFLDLPLTPEQRAKVVAHCSFGAMKDNKMVNREGVPMFEGKGKFMRKGVVGDWKNY
ncbi:hypothetical protein PENTCL1PPCAC_9754, partial [Pristionchus entomophagus]